MARVGGAEVEEAGGVRQELAGRGAGGWRGGSWGGDLAACGEDQA